jgi:hypothetical protein
VSTVLEAPAGRRSLGKVDAQQLIDPLTDHGSDARAAPQPRARGQAAHPRVYADGPARVPADGQRAPAPTATRLGADFDHTEIP